ncbi:MAG: preprotein translocase subunit YajC [Bacteroidales bacterium]|nr:preprotein translocase subunit YajC [Bacteroidales bacterium]
MNILNAILVQSQSGGSGWSGMLMIVAMIVVFYFFMIRPQQKKQKEIKKQRDAMQKNDKVVTAGGIHGRIKEIDEHVVMIEVAPGTVLKVDKGSVYPVGQAPAKDVQ